MKAAAIFTPEVEASIPEADAIIARMDTRELQSGVEYSAEEDADYALYLACQ